jgi:hypothetical protein
VHQLWPLEDHVRSTNFDVVFFHGLHWPSEKEAWESTWTQLDDPQDCWPQNWLPQDLDENVRVLSISYDACPTQSEEKESIDDVSEIGKNILQTLVLRFLSTHNIPNTYSLIKWCCTEKAIFQLTTRFEYDHYTCYGFNKEAPTTRHLGRFYRIVVFKDVAEGIFLHSLCG